MKVEVDEVRKLVIVWLCSDEDKSLAQPIIDQYRESKYMVTLFCSGKKPLFDKTRTLLTHNRSSIKH